MSVRARSPTIWTCRPHQLHRRAPKLDAKVVAKRNDGGETLEDEGGLPTMRSRALADKGAPRERKVSNLRLR